MARELERAQRAAAWMTAVVIGGVTTTIAAGAAAGGQVRMAPLLDPHRVAVSPHAVTRIVADVSIRRHRAAADGDDGLVVPEVVYRVERTLGDGGWAVVMRRLREERPVVRTEEGERRLETPPAIARLEAAADGPVKVFNALGVEVRLPSKAALATVADGESGALRRLALSNLDARAGPEARQAVDHDVLGGLLISAEQVAAGRRTLERRFGPAVERGEGFVRHTRLEGNQSLEVLVDALTGVPVEIIVMQEGRRVERTRHTYLPAAGGGLVRRAVRSERLVPGSPDRQLVTEVEFANVRVAVGGAR